MGYDQENTVKRLENLLGFTCEKHILIKRVSVYAFDIYSIGNCVLWTHSNHKL